MLVIAISAWVVAMVHSGRWVSTAGLGILVVVAGVAAVWDLGERRIPNRLTYPMMLAVWAGLWLVGAFMDGEVRRVVEACAAGLVVGVVLMLVGRRIGLGMGDVKLAVPIVTVLWWFGSGPVLVGIAAGALLGGLTGVLTVAEQRRNPAWVTPYGPALFVGLVAGLVAAGLGFGV